MLSISVIDKYTNENDTQHRINSMIKESLRYYDGKSSIIDYLSSRIVRDSSSFDISMGRRIINVVGQNQQKIISSEYEILGRIYTKLVDGKKVFSIWSWSWADASADQRDTFLTKKIQRYFAENELFEMTFFFKNIFNRPTIEITDTSHLDVIVSISADVLKNPYIIPVYTDGTINGYGIVEYIILTDINQLNALYDSVKDEITL